MSTQFPEDTINQVGPLLDYCNGLLDVLSREVCQSNSEEKINELIKALNQIKIRQFQFTDTTWNVFKKDDRDYECLSDLINFLQKNEDSMVPFPTHHLDDNQHAYQEYSKEELNFIEEKIYTGLAIKISTLTIELMHGREQIIQEAKAYQEKQAEDAKALQEAIRPQTTRRQEEEYATQFIEAARDGDGEAIEFKIQSDPTLARISNEDLEEAIIEAIVNGHNHIFDQFSGFIHRMSSDTFIEALREAAVGGHEHITSKLMEYQTRLDEASEDELVEIFINVAKEGHVNIANDMMEKEKIASPDSLGNALIFAAQGGHRPIVERIIGIQANIENNITIPHHYFRGAHEEAINAGHNYIARLFGPIVNLA